MNVHFKAKRKITPLRGTINPPNWRAFEATAFNEFGTLFADMEVFDIVQTLTGVIVLDMDDEVLYTGVDVIQVNTYWYLLSSANFENMQRVTATA